MRFRYSKFRPDSQTAFDRLKHLASLFSYLMLKTNGDVEEALEWLRNLAKEYGMSEENLDMEELINSLIENGTIQEVDDVLLLTTRGQQRIRKDALLEIFSSLRKGNVGNHETPMSGSGIDRLSETRKWALGDAPTNIDLTSTLTNAFKRDGIENFTLREEDLEVYETEHVTSCATILLLDISHSMILYGEDRITPAKQVALALAELIMQRYPKDYLALIAFGNDAKLVSLAELPFLSVGPYYTNTRAALAMARQLLGRRRSVNKQIFMVTDGKPSAIINEHGKLYKNSYGLDPRIINKTLDEAVACRREKITISTFMLARDPYLVNFVEELTKANKGRAYYSQLENLGQFIFVDYIRNRRKRFSGGA